MPHAAITTDIIVGFPGETEEDFEQTLDLVEQARFTSAFTFQYSPRPGTPAAVMENQVEPSVVTDRYQRLVARINDISWEANRALVGSEVEVLVATHEGRKDGVTNRVSGRARDNRLVHVGITEGQVIKPGDFVSARITYAAPHHLIADEFLGHRPRKLTSVPNDDVDTLARVSLGMPAMPRV